MCHLFSVVRIAVNIVSVFNYHLSSLNPNSAVLLFIKYILSVFYAVFYDIGSPKARAQQELKINVNLNKRSVLPRLWEIRISQIPFSARAPSGCLQYFTGSEGKYLYQF